MRSITLYLVSTKNQICASKLNTEPSLIKSENNMQVILSLQTTESLTCWRPIWFNFWPIQNHPANKLAFMLMHVSVNRYNKWVFKNIRHLRLKTTNKIKLILSPKTPHFEASVLAVSAAYTEDKSSILHLNYLKNSQFSLSEQALGLYCS